MYLYLSGKSHKASHLQCNGRQFLVLPLFPPGLNSETLLSSQNALTDRKTSVPERQTNFRINKTWRKHFRFHLVWVIVTSDVIDGTCYAVGYWVSETAKEVAGIYIFIMEYLFPVVLMTFCYGRIYLVLRTKVYEIFVLSFADLVKNK